MDVDRMDAKQSGISDCIATSIVPKRGGAKSRGGFRPRKRKKSFARLGSLQRKANQRERRRAQRIRDGFQSLAEALAASGAVGEITAADICAGNDRQEPCAESCGSDRVADARASSGADWTQISTLTTACAYIGHLGRLLRRNGGAQRIDVDESEGRRQAAGAKRKFSADDETDISGDSEVDAENDIPEHDTVEVRRELRPSKRAAAAESSNGRWSLRPPAKRRADVRMRSKTERFAFHPDDGVEQALWIDSDSCVLCELWGREKVATLTRRQNGSAKRKADMCDAKALHVPLCELPPEAAEVVVATQEFEGDEEDVAVDVTGDSDSLEASHMPKPGLNAISCRVADNLSGPVEDSAASNCRTSDQSTSDPEIVSALLTLGKEVVCFDQADKNDQLLPRPEPAEEEPQQEMSRESAKEERSPPKPVEVLPEGSPAPAENLPVDMHLRYSGYTLSTAARKRMPSWPMLPPSVLLPAPAIPWQGENPHEQVRVMIIPSAPVPPIFPAVYGPSPFPVASSQTTGTSSISSEQSCSHVTDLQTTDRGNSLPESSPLKSAAPSSIVDKENEEQIKPHSAVDDVFIPRGRSGYIRETVSKNPASS